MAVKQSLEEISVQLKKSLVEELSLEDITPEEIKDDEILFGEDGLGLDSLDAVEIVLILQQNWGIDLTDMDMEKGREIFASLDVLVQYIYDHAQDL
ncbi:Acyl-carrier protein-like protein [Desulfamplus magnetovallimortis]|uniref:Acyl-carrier protein-like protein n=1 Tax=Desulfamplus magnetovallimortis TaxID=1246637 RepID=L0R717_9BACT|nr:phosphopantetheine-binding protein [Desulfamplus magnetovallimortis]CCO06761.1 Acyl-carrier protein-like protein [Desulfamplus magnetovallimortis BW-1]SLM32812.1 Acyl-carrier protein-like protein [Desulfamplus magnetovallimortis]